MPTSKYEDDGAGISNSIKKSLFDQMIGGQKGFGMVLTGQILAITGITIHETGMSGKGVRFEIRGFPMEATGKRIPWCDYPTFRFLSLRKDHIPGAFRGVILIQGLLCEA